VKLERLYCKTVTEIITVDGYISCGTWTRFRVIVSRYGASRSHSLDAPHSAGLLWTSDQPHPETSTCQHTTLTTTNFHAPDYIRKQNPSKRAAPGSRLRTHDHCDRLVNLLITVEINRLVLCNSVTLDGWMIEAERLYFSYENFSWKVAVESTAAEGRGLKILPETVYTGCWNSCFFSVIPGKYVIGSSNWVMKFSSHTILLQRHLLF